MKRFDFSLERVRRWRDEQASLEELKLGKLRAERSAFEEARRQIETERSDSERQVLGRASIDPGQLASLDSYRQFAAGSVRQLEGRIQEAEARIDGQLKRVMEARRQYELLNRLRNSAFEQWRAAADKEQDELATELFLARAARRK